MKLISPSGVRFSISDERGEKLLAYGYKEQGAVSAAPAPSVADETAVKAPQSAPKRRSRSPKASTPDNQ